MLKGFRCCLISFTPLVATKASFEAELDLLILRSKINKSSSASDDYRVVQKVFCRLRRQNILLRDTSFSRFREAKS
jgi:hypothetical protein